MRKIFKLLFLLLAYQGYAQYAPFKGVFHEGGYAVYAYHPGDVSDFVPYKMYIFEERETITNGVVSAGYWVYDTITVDCPSFTIRLLTNKRFKLWGYTGSSGSGWGNQAMAAPPQPSQGGTHNGGEYSGTSMDYYEAPPNMQAIAALHRVEQFSFNTPYTADQLRFSGKVLDEFSTQYGKSDVLSLSSELYTDYKRFQKTPGLTLTNFLLTSPAHPLEKMILLQNQMNLFLTPHDYITAYGKTTDGDPPPPLWEPTPDCDTNFLKEVAKFMPVYGGQCNGSWADIYKCLQVNQLFNDQFNTYIQTIFPNWKSYWENCVKTKYEHEAEECRCQRYITLDGGKLSYWHQTAANKSILGIMPEDFHNNPNTGGGDRPGWLPKNGIGYNPYSFNTQSGNVKIGRSGSNQGVGGWDMIRSQVDYSTCSHYFEHTQKYGDTTPMSAINYYETTINYGCADFLTELAANCACPIPVQGRVMHRVTLAASSATQRVCAPFFQSSKHAGKLSHGALAYYGKVNQVTNDGEVKMLDAGQAQATTASSFSINKDFLYKLKKLTIETAKAVAAAIGGQPVIDTSLKDLIDQGLGLATTRFSYDTSVTSNSLVTIIDKSFNFFLYPNDEATVRLDNHTNFFVKGENAGWTELVLGKDFMVGLWSGAYKSNVCCRPPFIGVTHIGMPQQKNSIYTNLTPKGGNQERWDYDPLNHVHRWGMYNSSFCDPVMDIMVVPKSLGKQEDKQPQLIFKGNGFEYKNLTKGDYNFTLYSISGKVLDNQTINLSEPNGYIQLSLSAKSGEIILIELSGQNHRFTKKVKYERF